MYEPPAGLYVRVALLCGEFRMNPDGTASILGIAPEFNIPDMTQPLQIRITAVFMIDRVDVSGPFPGEAFFVDPNGARLRGETKFECPASSAGTTVVMPIEVMLDAPQPVPGFYRFVLFLSGRLASSIPLRLKQAEAGAAHRPVFH